MRKRYLRAGRANLKLQEEVFAIASAAAGVVCANGLVSTQLAPDQVVVALSVQFEDRLTTPEIENIVVEMEEKIRQARPQVLVLYVKPLTPDAFAAAQKRIRKQCR